MFSANSHQQQILFHLNQIKPKTSVYIKNVKHKLNGHSEKKMFNNQSNVTKTTSCSGNDLKILFPDKFNEAVKQFEMLPIASISCMSIEKLLNTNNVKLSFENVKKTKPWHVDYTTQNSFNESRCAGLGGISNDLSNCVKVVMSGLRSNNQGLLLQQRRGFKTERSVEASLRRNPTVSSRIKDIFSSTPNSAAANTKIDSIMFDNQTAVHQNESLNKLIHVKDEELSTDQKQKMKIAFAEGYLAGTHSENAQKPGKAMKYFKVFQQFLVTAVFIGIFISLFSSSNGSVFRIQIGNQVEVDPEDIHVTFEDVKGCDEAKQELKEVVEFLKNPDKFSNLGGKLPKGVLLVGPPGTGKTLLARAVAGEAGVPFFHAAGPEFDEVLVGQGARRVRDLFKAAKDRAPCVIFIDEIDSVGAKRTNSVLHPYANQTINQLLSEMDGFHQNEGVIVLGATNRRDDLDQALLRPGRFDVEVVVPTPDFSGRREILDMYLAKILHKDIDIDMLARGTTGFTGADLENMVNQAALRAAIDGADVVSMKHLESARDKVLMGPERKARLPDEEANKITAYHEGGHAIVAYYTKESHPLHKVTIMPRGPSLGHTAYIPEKERYHVTKAQLLAMMDTMMGGRAAEELIFGADKITSGASSDLKQATQIAAHMVKDWGMSEKVGLRTIEGPKGMMQQESLGPTTVEVVDAEIKKILSDSYERAKTILKAHSKEHKALAEALLKYETLDAEDIKAIMSGEKSESIGSQKL